ncbi:serine/threonine-protein kinase [Corynebacterium urogenitale]
MAQPDRTDIERIQRLLGDRYELSWIIGRGGMSTVWLAWDHREERDVAVKILKPEYTENEEFRSRFRNEAEASEDFRSENVVATYDYGEVKDEGGAMFCFIVMEYVRGESLADVLSRERTLPEALALDVMTQVALGLATIHEAGMVHRDIKPGNLLITPQGVVKITDFGIAKAAAAVPLTRTGMVVGTAQYVSPEQAQGNPVGSASDIYSLGVMTYEMVAGKRPFSGDSTVSVAIKHISEAPPALSNDISGPMRELIGICLRKNHRARYADGAELAAAAQYVAIGQRPPQPHLVPDVDVDTQQHTEQLGAVATGKGTAVPPRQGPAPSAPSAARRHAGPATRRDSGTAKRSASRHPREESSSGNGKGALIALGAVAALALGAIGFLLLSGDDEPAPNSETLTVTSEVTSEPTSEQPTTLEPLTTIRQTTPTDTSERRSTSERSSTSQRPSPSPERPAPEPEDTAPPAETPGGPESPGNGNGGDGGGNSTDNGDGGASAPTGNAPPGGQASPGLEDLFNGLEPTPGN